MTAPAAPAPPALIKIVLGLGVAQPVSVTIGTFTVQFTLMATSSSGGLSLTADSIATADSNTPV